MAILKCKMCGGNLEVSEDTVVAECEYCGTRQTVPTADNEKKLTMFNRANRLRLACEFDKAAGVYESIIAEFPTEAEAYWGLVLCRYGIEYVDDPTTGKKISTCHRSSFDSIMEDGDFEKACEFADMIAQKIYQQEARAIENLRLRILDVSGKEEPYDIFICYKDTDENGERTIDSVIAEEVYNALTERGYHVFFSRISLEDRLGTEYEPYIFAALNSAQVMLVFGTEFEYFNAVWVKNEWSRFLTLIATGQKKVLIPCYKNVDIYDMPKEFQRLQAQDMGKVGAMQDLLRGIEKLLSKDQRVGKDAFLSEGRTLDEANKNALLKRGGVTLEDGDWEKAKSLFDRILDMDVECADAHLGLVMANLKCHTKEELYEFCVERSDGFQDFSLFKRVREYADGELLIFLKRLEEEIMRKRTHAEEDRKAKFEAKKAELTPIRETAEKTIRKLRGFICFGGYPRVYGLTLEGTLYEYNRLYGYSSNHDECKNVNSWRDIVAVAAGDEHVVGLKRDGTVVAVGNNSSGQCNVIYWHDIRAIYAEHNHTIGLKKDGTVVATGDNSHGQCNVARWQNIVSIYTTSFYYTGLEITVGLKKDGTVVATGDNGKGQCNVSNWSDIVKIIPGRWTVGLKKDGTVVVTGDSEEDQCDVSDWKNIVDIAEGNNYIVGLKKDGTVVATGNNENGQCNVSGWQDIVAIYVSRLTTIGLKADGTIIETMAEGKEEGYSRCLNWQNIVAVCAGPDYVIGLKKDGTIIAMCFTSQQKWDICSWGGIVAIYSYRYTIVGITSDGRVRLTHSDYTINNKYHNDYGGYNNGFIPLDWKLFNSLHTLEEDYAKIEQQREEERREKERREEELKQAEWHKKEKLRALHSKQMALETELASLWGLFSGNRRKEIKKQLEEVEQEIAAVENGRTKDGNFKV